jgi:cysteinyl-tRNA synthetase
MLKIYNTLSKKKEEFNPLNPPEVTFYQCGPTVYWVQHLGNMRAMVLADLIRRSLSYLGYEVKFARNYTDVGHLVSDEDEGEDKISKTAKKEKLTPQEVAEKYIAQFDADILALNCLPADYRPKATDYIESMKAMVQGLLDKDFAYATELAIYFDVSKFQDYTKLSGRKLEQDQSQAGKGEVSDPKKKQPADFAVWFFKAGTHANALQTWPYDFNLPDGGEVKGEGFPGWHLECSAMNFELFGPTIDLHMGGIEHVSVHHSNEIAQSEAFTGEQFVKYWLHNEHLTVNGGKMSKSEGTSYALQDILDKGYDPLILRYFFLGAHYRSKQNFTWEALEGVKSALAKLKDSLLSFQFESEKVNQEFKQKFISALEDDFNLPQALAVVFEILKSDLTAGVKYATILDFDQVLGLNLTQLEAEEITEQIKTLAEARWQARAEKNWAESDKLRDELAQLGWQMEDGKSDYQLKKIN